MHALCATLALPALHLGQVKSQQVLIQSNVVPPVLSTCSYSPWDPGADCYLLPPPRCSKLVCRNRKANKSIQSANSRGVNGLTGINLGPQLHHNPLWFMSRHPPNAPHGEWLDHRAVILMVMSSWPNLLLGGRAWLEEEAMVGVAGKQRALAPSSLDLASPTALPWTILLCEAPLPGHPALQPSNCGLKLLKHTSYP